MNDFWNAIKDINTIVNILWSILLIPVTILVNQIVKKCENRKEEKKLAEIREEEEREQRILSEQFVSKFESFDFINNNYGIIELGHGVPFYDHKDISLSRLQNTPSFYYPIPRFKVTLPEIGEVYIDTYLKKKKFYQHPGTNQESNNFDYCEANNCISDSFYATNLFNNGFSCFNKEWNRDTKKEIADIAKEVALSFIHDIH